MLSRTAESLYWMARYIERADAMARLIEMGHRIAMLPNTDDGHDDDWRSVVAAAGCVDSVDTQTDVGANVISGLTIDRSNPSSIVSCFAAARSNGRAVRTALTRQMWESLNDGWLHLNSLDDRALARDLPDRLDWVKNQCALLRGAADGSMLRDEGWQFYRLGMFAERADMTLRLLDVKYFVLLPETDVVGGGRDHHQWTSVLHATSALRAFHWAYQGDYSPWLIADFLLLNKSFPRSLIFAYEQLGGHLDQLAQLHGERHVCHDIVGETIAALSGTDVDGIFQKGLHEFLSKMIGANFRLTTAIAEAYDF